MSWLEYTNPPFVVVNTPNTKWLGAQDNRGKLGLADAEFLNYFWDTPGQLPFKISP
jgi:hypothetical protein